MGKVIGLSPISVFNHGEPDPEVIEKLAALLEDAKTGRIRAVACVTVDSSRTIGTDWFGHCDQHDMIAGMNIVNFRLLKVCEVDGET